MSREGLDVAVGDFGHAVGLLLRRLRATSEESDLSWSQTAVMARLDRNGPATTAELARAEGVKPQSMGAIVASLEEMGIVERKPHPTDGRQVNIQLTTRGAILRESARDAKRTWLTEAISQLDEDEQETLFRAGEIVKRLAER
jgi:DNA-binding MarR family transcriptional regulator